MGTYWNWTYHGDHILNRCCVTGTNIVLQANYTLKTSKQTHLKIKSVVTRGRGQRERELDEGSQKLQTKKKKNYVLKFEMTVDLCAAVRNNRVRAYIPFTQFPRQNLHNCSAVSQSDH